MRFHRMYALRGFFGDSDNDVTVKNQDKTITENGTYVADPEYTGLGVVTVDVPGLEETRPNAEETKF